jgi:LemA protein
MQKVAALGCLAIIVLGAIVLFLVGVGGYNGLNTRANDVDGKWANVQSAYQRRSDLIPNLVQTVRASADFEKSTLQAVIDARASATSVKVDPSHAPTDPAQLEAYQKAQAALGGSLSRLLVSVERYPDLKTTTAFRDLQAQIEGTENRINVARNDFNASTQAYNTARRAFPTVLIAGMLGFQDKPFFKADENAQAAPHVGDYFATPTPAAAAH